MRPTRRDAAFGTAVAGLLAGRAAAAPGALPTEANIRALLRQRVDEQRQAVGMVAGVVSPQDRRIAGYGRLARDDRRTPNAATVFEIGSLTKVFTGLLFADMVVRGEVGLEDPLARHLPGVTVPERNGRTITLLDLATQTAGLPRFPNNPGPLPPGTPPDVFPWYVATASYRMEDFRAYLASYRLPREPGRQWEYSNVGPALLGLALCNRAGMDYGELLRRRITGPLGLRDTGLDPTAAGARRMTTGHELDLRPAPRWPLGVLAPAGGGVPTGADLATFLAAVMPGARSPLAAANDFALRTRRPALGAGYEQAIGWEIVPLQGASLAWKTGLTRGCTSVMAYDPAASVGVLVLVNSDRPASDIARHLLRPAAPLMRAFVATDVPPAVLDAYVGRYKLAIGPQLTVERNPSGLNLRYGDAPPAALTAISETAFLAPQATLEFQFRRGPDGQVAALAMKREGSAEVLGQRLSTAAP